MDEHAAIEAYADRCTLWRCLGSHRHWQQPYPLSLMSRLGVDADLAPHWPSGRVRANVRVDGNGDVEAHPHSYECFDGALRQYARRNSGRTDLLTTFALQAGGEGL